VEERRFRIVRSIQSYLVSASGGIHVSQPGSRTTHQLADARKLTYEIRVSHSTTDTATIEIDTSGNVNALQGGSSYLFFR
jgi:hypothetical protein